MVDLGMDGRSVSLPVLWEYCVYLEEQEIRG